MLPPTRPISVPALVLVLSFLGITKAAIGPIAELVIANKHIMPDGYKRSAVLAGGTFPGPLIRGVKGDTFKINVKNALTDPDTLLSTTVHWHGIYQKTTNWADGTAFVTQCPITTNHSFLYEFSVPDQAGTYWYHSHLSTQYCDGLRGAMVVYDPMDPHKHLYDIDDESTIITLADWYHVSSRSPDLKIPESTLINGKGRTRYDVGRKIALSVINIHSNKRYRFRLIGMACEASFNFSIDKHSMTIIEADGENTLTHEVDSIRIYAGQRYSVVVHANQPIDNYWIRADPSGLLAGFDSGRNSAILRYAGAPQTEPHFVQPPPSRKPLHEVDLRALTDVTVPGLPFPGGVDRPVHLKIGFNAMAWRFLMNNHSFIPPSAPALLQIISGAKTVQELMPKGSYYELKRGEVVELSLPGVGHAGHPFHMHGHSFWVVRSAGSDTYNFKNPVRRDTFNTGLAGSNATIRFVADSSGPWFLHCHVDQHLDMGLGVVFAEDIPNVVEENPVPEAWKELCPLYDALRPDQL
ncbi:laccase 1 [Collybia nuda]|uniref:Laccase 1 n=1 Tax=Collybia nuda TaxID=64659 RepID=A0A9P5XZ08_9AGAR|nr:laccase 1 [Collybia nuda]